MRTYLDCIPCMFGQALFVAREAGLGEREQKALLDEVASLVPAMSMESSPPELAVDLYRAIHRAVGSDDPYAAIKAAGNEAALSVYPDLVTRLRRAEDPLETAVRIAILGNIIDYGANAGLDLKREISKILREEDRTIAREEARLFDLEGFRSALGEARELLYLGDNAGEIVFDRILIECLSRLYPELKIRFAVRGRPIINDATLADAAAVGMDALCEVVDSGSPAPGAVLGLCTPEFRYLLERADLVISKGQGNYEALSGSTYPVYFLLRVKCAVLAAHIPAERGSVCLFRERG